MSKRKADDLYDFVLPTPKWPRWDEPERWTEHDEESAIMINTLHLDGHGPRSQRFPMKVVGPKASRFIKVSLFIQALDLVHFDDYEIILDADLTFCPYVHARVPHLW